MTIDKEAAANKTTEDRARHLANLSGLPVRGYRNGTKRWFVFGPPNRTIKTVYTYRKARTFAEGVAIGKIRTEMMEPKKRMQGALFSAGGFVIFGLAVTVLFVPQLAATVAFAALLIIVAGMSFGHLKN